jgi:hypothetical protein
MQKVREGVKSLIFTIFTKNAAVRGAKRSQTTLIMSAQVQPQGPYIVAGNRLAFALACALEARGCTLSSVIIMDDNPLWFDRREVGVFCPRAVLPQLILIN